MNVLRPSTQAARRKPAFVALLLLPLAALQAEPAPPAAKGHSMPAEDSREISPFDPIRFNTPAAEHYYFNVESPTAVSVQFLPPTPPPLGSSIPLPSPLATGLPPAPELAAHVADIFYPQLAARLAEDNLPERLRHRLENYRLARAALLDQLHAVLTRTEQAAAATRLRELTDLAERQAQALHELDSAAAHLRSELGGISPDKFAPPSRPATQVVGRLTTDLSNAEVRFLRSAAYHLNGLSNAQRRLLLELVLQNETRVDEHNGAVPFFFSPLGASVQLPPDLPAPVATELAAFTAAKRRLADELLALLRSPDRDQLLGRLEELATHQAPAFAALEARAEDLRHALRSPLELVSSTQSPALPPELATRLAAYRNHKQELLRQLHATLTQAARAAASPTEKPGGLTVPVAAFTAEQQAGLAALNREKDAIRAAIAEHRRAAGTSQDQRSLDDLLEAFERARHAQELREKYRDYRIAVLEPGLSPDQRRLLFDAALQNLGLPLPLGQPLRRP